MSSLDGDIFRILMFERCERMTKILTTLNQLNDYENLKDFCDGFLLRIASPHPFWHYFPISVTSISVYGMIIDYFLP